MDVDDSKKLASSLDNATRDNNPYFNKLLRILCTRWVKQAEGLHVIVASRVKWCNFVVCLSVMHGLMWCHAHARGGISEFVNALPLQA